MERSLFINNNYQRLYIYWPKNPQKAVVFVSQLFQTQNYFDLKISDFSRFVPTDSSCLPAEYTNLSELKLRSQTYHLFLAYTKTANCSSVSGNDIFLPILRLRFLD